MPSIRAPLFAFAFAATLAAEARAYPVDVSGSIAAEDFTATSRRGARNGSEADGFTAEMSLAASARLNRTVSVRARACIGCHAVELGEAYAEVGGGRTRIKAGRFTVPFGAIWTRYDAASFSGLSKPLPFAMGRMARATPWNQGVVPAPWADTGFSIAHDASSGSLRAGVEAYAVKGLEGTGPDLDWIGTRDPVDQNHEPSYGARATLGTGPITLGLSGAGGHYDPAGALDYELRGADLALTLGRLTLRGEYAARIQETADPITGARRDYKKDGWYAEAEIALTARTRLVGGVEGLASRGFPLGPAGPTFFPASALTPPTTRVTRWSADVAFPVADGATLKVGAERWDFSDFRDVDGVRAVLVVGF